MLGGLLALLGATVGLVAPPAFMSLDETSFFILTFLFIVIGVAAVWIIQRQRAVMTGMIAEVYVDVNGEPHEIKRLRIPVGAEQFNIGERQFLVDIAFATSYEKWNRWGGNVPVLRYLLTDARPLEGTIKPGDEVKPAIFTVGRNPKPSSGTVNLMIRRKGAAIMIQATRKVTANPMTMTIMGLVIGAALAYALSSYFHPGLVPAPPVGYTYKLAPINYTSIVTK